MRTTGWRYPIQPQAWPDLRDRYLSAQASWPGLIVMGRIVDSVIDGGAMDLLAAQTSMQDLVVVPRPVPEPPHDVIVVYAPAKSDDTIVIEYRAVTGRNDRIERPAQEAVRLFWRFVAEKYGIAAPNGPGRA